MSILVLQLFGRFQASIDDKQVNIGGATERALLSFLAMRSPAPATAEEMVELLWGRQMPEHAAERLTAVVSRLQESLAFSADPIIIGSLESGGLALLDTAVEIDAKRFEALAETENATDLEEAGKLYSDFLVGLAIRQSGFDGWLTLERRRLAVIAIRVFQRLSDFCAEKGDVLGAIEAAERLLILEPLDELIVQNLMRRHAEAGEQTLALQIYQDLVRELKASLNVDPTVESQELAQSIKAGATYFAGRTGAKEKGKGGGGPDIWHLDGAGGNSVCQVTIRPGDAANPALVELSDQLMINIDHDLNDGMAESIARRANLSLVVGVLHANDTDLRLEIRFSRHEDAKGSGNPVSSQEIVRSFDDVSSAMDGLRSKVRDAAADLILE